MESQLTKSASESTAIFSDSKKIADRFIHFRTSAGITQSDLADLVGISVGYVSQIERGIVEPSHRLLHDFEALEQSPVYTKHQSHHADQPVAMHEARVKPPPMQPPHHAPRISEDPPFLRQPQSNEPSQALGQCVQWLTQLMVENPQAFRAAFTVIQSLHEQASRKK